VSSCNPPAATPGTDSSESVVRRAREPPRMPRCGGESQRRQTAPARAPSGAGRLRPNGCATTTNSRHLPSERLLGELRSESYLRFLVVQPRYAVQLVQTAVVRGVCAHFIVYAARARTSWTLIAESQCGFDNSDGARPDGAGSRKDPATVCGLSRLRGDS